MYFIRLLFLRIILCLFLVVRMNELLNSYYRLVVLECYIINISFLNFNFIYSNMYFNFFFCNSCFIVNLIVVFIDIIIIDFLSLFIYFLKVFSVVNNFS